jgi:hypothetical protein
MEEKLYFFDENAVLHNINDFENKSDILELDLYSLQEVANIFIAIKFEKLGAIIANGGLDF